MLPLQVSGPESDGNEGVLYIPQSSSITEASPSDCLVPYIRTLIGGDGWSYPSAEKQCVFYNLRWLGHNFVEKQSLLFQFTVCAYLHPKIIIYLRVIQ